jgi:hypothetical protein
MTAPADLIGAVFHRHSRWDDLRAGDAFREADYTAWLAGQCPICEEGGGGPECDRCHTTHDEAITRLTDI